MPAPGPPDPAGPAARSGRVSRPTRRTPAPSRELHRVQPDPTVDVGRLEGHDVAQVGQVVLEAVAGDGGHDAVGHELRWLERAVVDRRLLPGAVPDVGGDGPGLDEADGDAGAGEVDGQPF